MLLTKSKGGGAAATSVDELKKQASAAAVATAVEVIKNGGTQADAAAAAKVVAWDILAKGQQQMLQRITTKEKKNGGLMSKLRKPRQNKKQAASPSKSKQPTAAAKSFQSPPDSTTTARADNDGTTDSRTESSGTDASSFSSSSGKASEVSSRAGDSKSTNSKNSQSSLFSWSSMPSIFYMTAKEGDKDNVSVISDGNTRTSASTIHVVDLLNMRGVMKAIDKAIEEQDVRSEGRRGGRPKRTWLDKLFSCDMCFGPGNISYTSSVASGDEPIILSKNATSVLSGGDKKNVLDTVEEEKVDSSDTAGADAAAKRKDSAPVSSPFGFGLKKTEGPQEVKVKHSVSWVEDGFTKVVSPRNSNNVSAGDAAVSSAAPPQPARAPPEPVRARAPPQPPNEGTKSPVTVSSKSSNSKDYDPSRSSHPAWKLSGKSTPKKQETSEVVSSEARTLVWANGQQQAPEAQLQISNNASIAGRDTTNCMHGLGKSDNICAEFAIAFRKAYYDVGGGEIENVDCLIDARKFTMVEFADVWNDVAKMELAMSYYLCCGVVGILGGDHKIARESAVFARYFEQYTAVHLHKTQALINWPKICEAYEADEHTLVKFFRRRAPCSCLDEKYHEVKHITKMGLCYNPQCQLDSQPVY